MNFQLLAGQILNFEMVNFQYLVGQILNFQSLKFSNIWPANPEFPNCLVRKVVSGYLLKIEGKHYLGPYL